VSSAGEMWKSETPAKAFLEVGFREFYSSRDIDIGPAQASGPRSSDLLSRIYSLTPSR
jgi:hypothetical protein